MPDDTGIGGPSAKFPSTRWSAIVAARSADLGERQRAFETLVTSYWKPVYKYIRTRWDRSNEDAKDLTQEFFARLIEKDFLASYDPAKSHLRTFLRVCVDGLVSNQDKAARRIKRGGDTLLTTLDFETAEGELARTDPPAPESTEEYFEREWVRSLFTLAVDTLRSECAARGKEVHFRLFEIYDLEDGGGRRPTYDELGRQFQIPVTDVTNHLAFSRREFRRIALEKLRETTSTEEEFRREARALLGVDAA